MENLSWNIFPLKNQANENDADRPGSLLLEYHDEIFTIGTLESTAEIATQLDEVYGLILLNNVATADDPTDVINVLTDGVLTSGAVTVNVKTLDVADGAIHIRFFLVGIKLPTVLLNTPTE